MSPLQIEIMLHHYYTPRAWNRPSLAAESDMLGLAKDGMLAKRAGHEPEDSEYEITAKGHAYCLALQAVPMPVEAWRLPGSDTVIA